MAKSLFSGPLAFVFEPLDWDALATKYRERSRWTKKGDKRPRADVEAQRASRRRNIESKQREATDRYYATRPRKRTVPRRAMTLQAMSPGAWCASVDVAQLYGWTARQAVTTLLQLEASGLVVRAVNPEWRPHVYRQGLGIHCQAQREPQWLWSLTPAGEAKKNGA